MRRAALFQGMARLWVKLLLELLGLHLSIIRIPRKLLKLGEVAGSTLVMLLFGLIFHISLLRFA
jgi:hypothetical protein